MLSTLGSSAPRMYSLSQGAALEVGDDPTIKEAGDKGRAKNAKDLPHFDFEHAKEQIDHTL